MTAKSASTSELRESKSLLCTIVIDVFPSDASLRTSKMALRDKSCYTLTIKASSLLPSAVELIESYGPARGDEAPRYARVKEPAEKDETYAAAIYDVLTGARLASFGFASEKAKTRRLQLHGPEEDVSFEFTGKINKYRWRREIYGKDYMCSLDRKPDPPVEICLAREAEKKEAARLQILHYNIERFPKEIKDLRGLETLLVASLMCLLDAWEHRGSIRKNATPALPLKDVPPDVPEKTISEEDVELEDPNEILVGRHTNIDDHIARAIGLLEDQSILFIVIRAKSPEAHQHALQVSLGVKRFRHREGLSDLHQYILEEEPAPAPAPAPATNPNRAGPKPINLDDPPPSPTFRPANGTTSRNRWTPPTTIAIYLSTIVLPDLNPARRAAAAGGVSGGGGVSGEYTGNSGNSGEKGKMSRRFGGPDDTTSVSVSGSVSGSGSGSGKSEKISQASSSHQGSGSGRGSGRGGLLGKLFR